MNVDLHVHSSEFSGCAVSRLAEQIESAKQAGLDAFALTDHHHLCDFERAAELGREHGFKIFTGIEINCVNYAEDFIVLGLNETELSGRKWYYEDLYDFTREKGGFIFFCHPYRYNDKPPKAIYTRVPDAVEIKSTNITPKESVKAAALAKKLGVVTLTNSDSHYSGNIGVHYNSLKQTASNDAELTALLKAGAYEPGGNALVRRIWEG